MCAGAGASLRNVESKSNLHLHCAHHFTLWQFQREISIQTRACEMRYSFFVLFLLLFLSSWIEWDSKIDAKRFIGVGAPGYGKHVLVRDDRTESKQNQNAINFVVVLRLAIQRSGDVSLRIAWANRNLWKMKVLFWCWRHVVIDLWRNRLAGCWFYVIFGSRFDSKSTRTFHFIQQPKHRPLKATDMANFSQTH